MSAVFSGKGNADYGNEIGLANAANEAPSNAKTKRKVNFTYLFFYRDKVPVSNRVFTEEIKLHYMFLVFPLIMQFYTQQSKSRDEYGVKSVSNLQTNIPNWKQIFTLVEGNKAT